MKKHDQESGYSPLFRKEEILTLVEHIKLHHSVELVGMKRVGINNFLHYFLAQKSNLLAPEYSIIMIDLNNLIERDLFAFWRLTLKRITDVVKTSSFPSPLKEKVVRIFDTSIQTNDIFLTFDGIREALALIAQTNRFPILIFNRFDRLKDVLCPELLDNLIALRNTCDYKMSYVFTGYRELKSLSPKVFQYAASSGFSQVLYIKPVSPSDTRIVASAIEKRYGIRISNENNDQVIMLSGGHVQYLRLCLLNLHEYLKKNKVMNRYFPKLKDDERITFLSEELWESLDQNEQEILKKIVSRKHLTSEEKTNLGYIEETGFIFKEKKHWQLFSPLFSDYVQRIIDSKTNGHGLEFTKQENKLFMYLKEHENQICERDMIIEVVWPEFTEWGASDWSLDKLIARVRAKLQKRQSPYQIITVRTRGYKLVS